MHQLIKDFSFKNNPLKNLSKFLSYRDFTEIFHLNLRFKIYILH
jgi:hypothetical protein